MKKYLNYFYYLCISIFILTSCKKVINETADVNNSAIIENIKKAYEAETKNQNLTHSKLGENIIVKKEVPVWEEYSFFPSDLITIVPIEVAFGEIAGSVQKYLVCKSNKDGKVIEINNYRLLLAGNNSDGKYALTENVNLLYTALTQREYLPNSSSVIQKYDLKGGLISEYKYTNGERIKLTDKEVANTEGIIVGNSAPIVCYSYIVDSWWITYLDGVIVEIEYLYSTTVSNCADGTGGAPVPPNTTVYEAIFHNNFQYTCPSNFTFTSVTTNNLWQEAGISNAHCNLVRIDPQTGQSIVKLVQIPVMYFGIPYLNQSGGVMYSSNQAKVRAANAFNDGEVEMHRYFKNNPNATEYELRQKWIQEADRSMKNQTNGAGKVTLQPSINPINAPVIKPYEPCT